MDIMEPSGGDPDVKMQEPSSKRNPKKADRKDDGAGNGGGAEGEAGENVFSGSGLLSESVVRQDGLGKGGIKISSRDKIAFVDAVVSNGRFTKDYSLFGGRMTLTVRSLTSDEVNALASWTARQGAKDPSGLMAGRYRKYLVAAHVAMLDGVEMPPLEEPLYERLGEDGKTVEPPGWLKRSDYWDGFGYGKFTAIVKCLQDFDVLYSTLCMKAEDANFWNPDTP